MRQMEDKTKEELQKAQQANSSSVPKVILAVRSDYNLVQSLVHLDLNLIQKN